MNKYQRKKSREIKQYIKHNFCLYQIEIHYHFVKRNWARLEEKRNNIKTMLDKAFEDTFMEALDHVIPGMSRIFKVMNSWGRGYY